MIRMCCHESLNKWHLHGDQVDSLYGQCKLEVVCHKEVEEPILNMVEFPKGKKPEKGQNEQELREVKHPVEAHAMKQLQNDQQQVNHLIHLLKEMAIEIVHLFRFSHFLHFPLILLLSVFHSISMSYFLPVNFSNSSRFLIFFVI